MSHRHSSSNHKNSPLCGTYPGVGANVHLQAIVLAESFVTVRALVRTLTWGETKHQNPEMHPQRMKAFKHSSLSNLTASPFKEQIWTSEKLQIILPEQDAVLDQNITLCWLILHYNMWHRQPCGKKIKPKRKYQMPLLKPHSTVIYTWSLLWLGINCSQIFFLFHIWSLLEASGCQNPNGI